MDLFCVTSYILLSKPVRPDFYDLSALNLTVPGICLTSYYTYYRLFGKIDFSLSLSLLHTFLYFWRDSLSTSNKIRSVPVFSEVINTLNTTVKLKYWLFLSPACLEDHWRTTPDNDTCVADSSAYSNRQRGQRGVNPYTLRDKEKASDWDESCKSWRQTCVVLAGSCCRWKQSVSLSRRRRRVLQETSRLGLSTLEEQLSSCDCCFPSQPASCWTAQ